MRAQLIFLSRAVPTQALSRSSTCEAMAAISGRCANSSSSVIAAQGAPGWLGWLGYSAWQTRRNHG